MTLTINIPVVVVVVVVVVDVIGRCHFQQFFFQSYHDGQLSLLRSTSCLRVLSEQSVLSSVTENQWQGEIIYMKVCNLIKMKAHIPSIAVPTFKSQINNQTHFQSRS